MSVEIECPKGDKMALGDVPTGECFLFDSEVCMRVSGSGFIELRSGAHFLTEKNTLVEPVDVKIIVTRR